MRSIYAACSIAGFAVLVSHASALLTASISAGTLEGGRCVKSDATTFQSIPYALPPTGSLRFAPPLTYNRTFPGGHLNATTAPPGCSQFGKQFVEAGPQSEDCLFINVWVPPNATASSGLPVKVWVYGGGEQGGKISDPLYNGCILASKNTLVVGINYRVGPLGFLALESAGIQGNMGIQDILLGLQWIQDNIAAFGGDPKKVLLFGQSAGADNTFIIATLPQAPSLFKAAITESGGGRDSRLSSYVQAQGANFSRSIGCNISDIACLRSKTPSELNTTLGANIVDPYVDGKTIPSQPSEVGTNVPMILGSNAMDGTFSELGIYGSPTNVTSDVYNSYLQAEFGPAASLVAQKYPISLFNHTPYPAFFAYDTVSTDSEYKCPAYRGLSRAAQKDIPVWTYLYNHTLSCAWWPAIPQDKSVLQLLGPTHTMEIPLVFGNIDGLPLPGGHCNLTDSEHAISDALIGAWSSMAATANPGQIGAISWPRWEPSASQGLVINNSSEIGLVDYSVCQFWDVVDAMLLNTSEKANNVTMTGMNANVTSASPGASSTAAGTNSAASKSAAMAIGQNLGGALMTLTGATALVALF